MKLKTGSAPGSTVILQSYSTSRIAFGERLGTHILRLTGSRSGKGKISALRLSERTKLVTLRSSSLSVGLTPRSSGKWLKTLRINPPLPSCPCPLKLMVWLLLTRSRWLSSLITTSLSQDSYFTPPCLLTSPTFPHLPPLLMQLAPMLLPLFSPAPLQNFSLQAVAES